MWTRLTSYTQYGMTTMCVLRMYVYIVFKKIIHNQRERERDTRGAVLVCALFSKIKRRYTKTQKFLIRLIQYTRILFTFLLVQCVLFCRIVIRTSLLRTFVVNHHCIYLKDMISYDINLQEDLLVIISSSPLYCTHSVHSSPHLSSP